MVEIESLYIYTRSKSFRIVNFSFVECLILTVIFVYLLWFTEVQSTKFLSNVLLITLQLTNSIQVLKAVILTNRESNESQYSIESELSYREVAAIKSLRSYWSLLSSKKF